MMENNNGEKSDSKINIDIKKTITSDSEGYFYQLSFFSKCYKWDCHYKFRNKEDIIVAAKELRQLFQNTQSVTINDHTAPVIIE